MTEEEKKERKAKRHERYLKERQKVLEMSRRYYQEHKKEYALNNATYYADNKERLRKVRHEYYLKHKEKWKNLKSTGEW